MLIAKFFALLFSFVPLIISLICWRRVKTVYNLASVYGIFWFGYGTLPLILLPLEPCSAIGPFYIAGFSTLVGLPTIVFGAQKKVIVYAQSETDNKLNYLRVCSWLLIATIAGVFAVLNTVLNGFSIVDIFTDPLGTAAKYTIKRYSETLITTVYGQLSLILQYAGVTLGGIIYEQLRGRRSRWLILAISFIPALFMMLAQSAKGFLFLAGAMFIAARIASTRGNENYSLIRNSSIISGLILGTGIFLSVFFSMAARYNGGDGFFQIKLFTKIFRVLKNYAFGHLYAFDAWIQFYAFGQKSKLFSYEPQGLGFYTFTSIYNILGGTREHKLGTYSEFYSSEYISTNIYTIYRGLILDLGISGSLLFALLFGGICLWIHNHLVENPNSLVFRMAYVFTFGFAFMSYGASLLSWNSVIVAIFFATLVLIAVKAVANLYILWPEVNR